MAKTFHISTTACCIAIGGFQYKREVATLSHIIIIAVDGRKLNVDHSSLICWHIQYKIVTPINEEQ